MSLEIDGKIVKIMSELSGESKFGRWMKQEFVIETNERYPKKICFTAWGDTTDIIKKLNEGDGVKVSFNPESREYNERWYTDLRAWKIEKAGGASSAAPPEKDEFKAFTENDIPPPEEEDLPF